ncbi:MAG: hypothetical protein AAB492_02840 [Patescibacteria group bacterium]
MSYYLRKITGNRWLTLNLPKNDGDIPADPVTDLKTNKNSLSFYKVDDKNIDTALTGLASKKPELQSLAFVLIKERDFKKFTLKPCPGDTPCQKANQLHVEIENLTVTSLVELVKIIGSNKAFITTKPKPVIQALLKDAYSNKMLTTKVMTHTLHKELGVECDCCKLCD